MDDKETGEFLRRSLRLASSCNSSVLVVVRSLRRMVVRDRRWDSSGQRLAHRYLQEIMSNYQSSEKFFAGLEADFTAVDRRRRAAHPTRAARP